MKTNMLMTAVAVFFLGSLASAAEAETIYECTFKKTASSGLTPPNVIFAISPESGKVMVSDGFIAHYMKTTSIAGTIKSDSAAKLTIGWDVRATNNLNQTATITFRLSYLKKDQSAFLTAAAMGYTNVDRADGRCKTRKG